jgi:hypothetical protein
MARSPHGQPLEHKDEQPRPWRRRQRDLGYVSWASFLMACAASAVFFAMVDPEVLSGTTTPGWEISRQAGYAIGFFGFWALTAATSVFVIWLVRTENGPRNGSGTRSRADGRKSRRRRRDPLRRRARDDGKPGYEERP